MIALDVFRNALASLPLGTPSLRREVKNRIKNNLLKLDPLLKTDAGPHSESRINDWNWICYGGRDNLQGRKKQYWSLLPPRVVLSPKMEQHSVRLIETTQERILWGTNLLLSFTKEKLKERQLIILQWNLKMWADYYSKKCVCATSPWLNWKVFVLFWTFWNIIEFQLSYAFLCRTVFIVIILLSNMVHSLARKR